MQEKDLIIVPTYNEKENIGKFLNEVLKTFPEVNILVIDDSSPDGTANIVKDISSKDNRIQLICRSGKMGLGTAYVEGFKWALKNGFERVYEMDADFSHDPTYLPSFKNELLSGNHIVIGSRRVPGGKVEGWGALRHIISAGGSLYSRLILGLPVKDLTSGYKGIRKEVLETLNWDNFFAKGFFFQVETNYRAWKAGFKLKEIPIVFRDRTEGKSKMSRKIFFEALWLALKLRFRV